MPPLNRRTSINSAANGDGRPEFGSRYFGRILLGSFVFSAAINVLMLSVPLYSLQVFSRAIPSGNIDTLIMLTLITVLALSMIGVMEVVRTRLLTRAGNAIEVAWRRRFSGEVVESAARGRPDMTPLGDMMEVKAALSRPTFAALLDLPWTPIYVVGIWLIHPVLGGLMLGSMVILTALGLFGHWAVKGISDDAKQPASRAQRLFDAVTTRADTVRALRMGPAVVDMVVRDTLTTSALSAQAAERGASIAAVTKWIRYLLQVAVTGVGAWLVIEQHLSFGGMIATSMLVARGMGPIEQTMGAWTQMLKTVESWRRLSALIKRVSREPVRGGVNIEPERLTAENVLFVSPRDQKPILRAVTLTVEPGQTICVLGANRSGKSVLARLLAGVQAPSAGTLRLGGLAVSALTPKDPMKGIGFLPQRSDLFPGTIAENIARFQEVEDDSLVIAAAKRAGIHEWIESLPMGYETEVNDPANPITGATARLIALARAGFGEPVLMVLDEPAAGLDEQGIAAVRRFIAEAKQRGTTTIVLSYMPVFVDASDKTYILQNGMVHDVPNRAQQAQPAQPHGQGEAAVPAASWGRMRSVGGATAAPAVE